MRLPGQTDARVRIPPTPLKKPHISVDFLLCGGDRLSIYSSVLPFSRNTFYALLCIILR